MYGSMEQSTAAAAPALGPEEVKFVRKLMATNGDDARPAGLSHESQASSASTLPTLATQVMSASTLAKLEAASDEVELQPSVWDSSLFLFNPVAGRSASLFAFLLLAVNVFLQGSFAFYLVDGLDDKPLTNDDVNELKWWRRHVAHSLEFYNEEKGESLARRVCNDDYGVEGSGVQSNSVWKSTSVSGAPDNSSLSHFSAMTRPIPLGRAAIVRCSRRRIQISTLFAAKREDAATRAACRRTSGTARGRPPVIKLYCIYTPSPHSLRTFYSV